MGGKSCGSFEFGVTMGLPATLLLAVLPLAAPAIMPVPLGEATLKSAIQAYAPILVCQEGEAYLPTCVESYLEITEPYLQVEKGSGLALTGLRHRQGPGIGPGERAWMRRGDPERAKAYVNVRVGAATTELQYWFLYAYNGPGSVYLKRLGWNLRYAPAGDYELGEVGVHEGDWEHITVTIDNRTGRATGCLYLAAHRSGEYVELSRCQVPVGGELRLQVHASRNGHASYPEAERYYQVTVKAGLLEFRLLNDASAPGLALDFRNRWEFIGLQGDPALKAAWEGRGWVEPAFEKRYPGRWGRVLEKPYPFQGVVILGGLFESFLRALGAFDELTEEAGPYPPWSKGSWTVGE